MSTVAPPIKNGTANVPAVVPFEQRSVNFTPLAEAEAIDITVGMVKNILAVRSRSGREPNPSDIMKFMMLCKSRKLNPFVGDAYLLGYDSQDGETQWSLITAIQALRKRAESHPQFDGLQCGVVLMNQDGTTFEREGGMVLGEEKLVGGWSVCYRKDRKIPARATVKLSVYDTGRSRWKKDPGGMITKVAEAAALRQAFPSDLAGMYIRDEFGDDTARPAVAAERTAPTKSLDDLADRIAPAPKPADSTVDRTESQETNYDEGELSPEELRQMEEAEG